MQPKYQLANTQYTVSPVRHGSTRVIEISGENTVKRQVCAEIQWLGHSRAELTINNGIHQIVRQVYAIQSDQTIYVHMDGKAWQLNIVDEFKEAGGDAGQTGSGQVKAPMPGVVLDIHVKEGDQVEEGQVLMLIESMKLQMEVKASLSGRVQSLGVDGPGSGFDKGAGLVNIKPGEMESSQ